MGKYIKNIGITIDENACLNIILNEDGLNALKSLLLNYEQIDFSGSYFGAGMDTGHISVQYPISSDSHTYVFSIDDETDDGLEFETEENKEAFFEIVNKIISEADDDFDREQYEYERLFKTWNVEKHDNMILHGYVNNLNLCLLENNETGEAYVIFSTNPLGTIFEDEFKTFSDIDEAKEYIKSNIRDDETLQDFSISHRIYNDIHDITDSKKED